MVLGAADAVPGRDALRKHRSHGSATDGYLRRRGDFEFSQLPQMMQLLPISQQLNGRLGCPRQVLKDTRGSSLSLHQSPEYLERYVLPVNYRRWVTAHLFPSSSTLEPHKQVPGVRAWKQALRELWC